LKEKGRAGKGRVLPGGQLKRGGKRLVSGVYKDIGGGNKYWAHPLKKKNSWRESRRGRGSCERDKETEKEFAGWACNRGGRV